MTQNAMICRTTDPHLQMLYSARAQIYSMAVAAAAVQGPGQQASGACESSSLHMLHYHVAKSLLLTEPYPYDHFVMCTHVLLAL